MGKCPTKPALEAIKQPVFVGTNLKNAQPTRTKRDKAKYDASRICLALSNMPSGQKRRFPHIRLTTDLTVLRTSVCIPKSTDRAGVLGAADTTSLEASIAASQTPIKPWLLCLFIQDHINLASCTELDTPLRQEENLASLGVDHHKHRCDCRQLLMMEKRKKKTCPTCIQNNASMSAFLKRCCCESRT